MPITIDHQIKAIKELIREKLHKQYLICNKQHHDKLEQIYTKFNEDLKKYILVNQFQNTALKRILELGFIDLIIDNHKKIAKDQIKELDKLKSYTLNFDEIPIKKE